MNIADAYAAQTLAMADAEWVDGPEDDDLPEEEGPLCRHSQGPECRDCQG